MLHGLFPVRDAAIAFIGPGWSISVEWQFYIIAPFVYMFLKRRAVVGGLLIIMLILLRNIIDNTVFLPRYMEYFALGIGSFYLYRKRSIMVTFLLFLVSLYYFKNHPITYWMLFLCIDPRIFVNHITLYCGKISYSIYLTHTIVLYCVQFVLLQWTLSQTTHFIFLLVGTIAGTIALSSLTYRYVEKKGIEFGAALAKRVS
jgi:peptidoglycan/LPS O-acetylase OafA/YrhL